MKAAGRTITGTMLVLALVLVVIVAVSAPMRESLAAYITGVYKDNGGDRLVISSTGTLLVESGGTLTIEDGALEIGDVELAEGSVVVGDASGFASALDASTTTQILIGNGTTITSAALSGDVTMANTGAVTVAATSIENSMLAGGIAVGKVTLAEGSVVVGSGGGVGVALDGKTTTQILIGNGTTMTSAALSGDVTMDNAGAVTIAGTSVENGMLAGSIAVGKVSLAEGSVAVGSAGGVMVALDGKTTTQILIGNGTTMTSAALSGDMTMDNAGAVTIAGTSVENGMLAGSIAVGKVSLAEGSVVVGSAGGVMVALDGKTTTQILVGNGTTMTSVALSGDATMGNDGTVAIAAGVIVDADVSASAAITSTKIACADGDFLVGNVSNQATGVTMSGDATISNAGVLTIGATAVENSMLAGSIAVGKVTLAEGSVMVGSGGGVGVALDGSTTTQILVGNGTTMTSVAVSGDATMANDGTLTIAAGAVEDAMLSSSLVKRPAVQSNAALQMTGVGVDQEIITLNGRVYELDTDSTPDSGGDVLVDVSGGVSADQTIAALVTAINGDDTAVMSAVGDSTNDIMFLYADTAGVAGNSLTTTEGFTNGTMSAATMVDGSDAAVGAVVAFRHTVTANEASGGAASALRFDSGLSSIEAVHVSIEDAGVDTALGATVTVSGGVLTLVEGTPAWATSDIINVIIVGTE